MRYMDQCGPIEKGFDQWHNLLNQGLGEGEASVILLGKSVNAGLVLIDDLLGRNHALKQGLNIMGLKFTKPLQAAERASIRRSWPKACAAIV